MIQSTIYSLMVFVFSLLFVLCTWSAKAQQELQIHHINIENGDATMIAVFDHTSNQYLSKILIDGGQSSPEQYLLPYLSKVSGDTHFNYVILTHYHNDHYNGLLALKNGQLTADSLVDPGGYNFATYFPGQAGLSDGEMAPAALPIATQWTSMLQKAVAGHYLKGHSGVLVSFGTGDQTGLGHKLNIGSVNGVPVTLECVAGWGNTLSDGAVVADPSPDKGNANNFSLAFILRYGEFRYFIGGDLGGSDKGLYIDQEDPLIGYLAKDLPPVHTMYGLAHKGGHSCGFKADHHGSSYANDAAFIDAMSPAIAVTSAGNNASWHLPQVGYLGKLAALPSLSPTHGVYFTNLYDWGTGKNSLATAWGLFSGKPGISFDYGNPAGKKYSYVVRVKADHILTESDFEVDRVDLTLDALYTKLADFQCHKL
jgi:hypothetical protein